MNYFSLTNNGNTRATIFLDIKKAFDELKCYGVDGTVILWLENYLTDRKQANVSVNKLSLNTYKTKILIFDKALLSVKINIGSNYAIKECKSFKFLGLIVDNLLKFDFHVDYIKKKIQKIGDIYRGSRLLPVKYRKKYSNALILPHFDNLDSIYGRASKAKLNELDILYKKTESSINVYRDIKCLLLHLRRQVHLSSYMFKIIKGDSPRNFKI